MSAQNRYGRIVTRTAVERAVVATLQKWMDDSLGEIERVDGWDLNEIQRPLGIVTRSEFARWPEEQIPVILVICPGLADTPTPFAQGAYSADWLVGVAPIVAADELDSTRDLAGAYSGAVKLSLLQHGMLKSPVFPDGFAVGTDWVDEQDADIPFLSSRSLASIRTTFKVSVDNVVTKWAGPEEPSAEPWVDPGPWPTVNRVEVNAAPVPIGGSVS